MKGFRRSVGFHRRWKAASSSRPEVLRPVDSRRAGDAALVSPARVDYDFARTTRAVRPRAPDGEVAEWLNAPHSKFANGRPFSFRAVLESPYL